MKLFVSSILICITSVLFAQNNFLKLQETINVYGKLYISDSSEIPETYILTKEEFKRIAPKKADSVEILKKYIQYQGKVKRKFESAKNSTKFRKNIISFDTITYRDTDYLILDVCVIYKEENPSTIETTECILSKFIVIGDSLKLMPSIRVLSKLEFAKYELNVFNEDREKEFYEKYKMLAYMDTLQKIIPYKKGNVWGLKNYAGKIIVNAQYDSLYPYRENFAIVVKNNSYNLLDTEYKIRFPEWKSKIYYVEDDNYLKKRGKYYIKEKSGTYTIEDYIESENKIKIKVQDEVEPNNQSNVDKSALPYKSETKSFYAPKNYILEEESLDNGKKIKITNSKTLQTVKEFNGYTNIETFGDFFVGEKQDSTIVIDSIGTIIFTTKAITKPLYPGYIILYDKPSRLFGVYCPYTKTYIPPQYYFIKPIGRDSYFVILTKQKAFGYLNAKGEMMIEKK